MLEEDVTNKMVQLRFNFFYVTSTFSSDYMFEHITSHPKTVTPCISKTSTLRTRIIFRFGQGMCSLIFDITLICILYIAIYVGRNGVDNFFIKSGLFVNE